MSVTLAQHVASVVHASSAAGDADGAAGAAAPATSDAEPATGTMLTGAGAPAPAAARATLAVMVPGAPALLEATGPDATMLGAPATTIGPGAELAFESGEQAAIVITKHDS